MTAFDGGFNRWSQRIILQWEVCAMNQRKRIFYSTEQRAEIWDRWRRGESMSSIGRRFDRESSSMFSVLSPSGGIRPAQRRRAARALRLAEREDVSRGPVRDIRSEGSPLSLAGRRRRSAERSRGTVGGITTVRPDPSGGFWTRSAKSDTRRNARIFGWSILGIVAHDRLTACHRTELVMGSAISP